MGYSKCISSSRKMAKHFRRFIGRHKCLTIVLALFFLFFLSTTAITYKFGPYSGRVIDAETKEPIEGAVVYLVCSTVQPNPGGGSWVYAGAAETLTNTDGQFILSYRAWTFRFLTFWDDDPQLFFLKPGYGVFPGHKNASIIPDVLYIPTGKPITIQLPKLVHMHERRENFRRFYPRSYNVPYRRRKHTTNMLNQERLYLGYEPEGVD